MSQPPNVTTSSQPPPVAVAADSPPTPAASLPPPADPIPPPVSIAPSPPPPPPSSSPPPASSPPPPLIISPPPNTTPPAPDTTPPPPPPDITPSPPPSKPNSGSTYSSPSPSPSPSASAPGPLASHSRQGPTSYYGKLIPSSSERTINSLLKNEKVILAGVVAGAGLLLFIMILMLVCLTRRRRRRSQRDDDMHYYRDNSSANGYYNNSGTWSNTNGSHNHEMRMPPSTQVSSEYSWQIQPPPPPPPMMMNSNEMMNYSASSFSSRTPPHPPPLQSTISLGINQSSFSYQDLAAATGGFAQANLLGQGGFGYVHKGVLPNGKEVAVKSLKANSGQGETEFQAEVDIISRVHHRHLVSLVGYCISGSQRMLVYELVPNDTLESHLHGTGYQVMDWPTRMKVALGAAKGFSYLHEDCHPRIIHRDIKASNILLDENFEAKVADFGLAKLSLDTNTHISTRIMGTFGYLAPEYAASGKLTEKSDVYSYGVVLLELITGRRPIDINSEEDSLVDWARPILKRAIEGESGYDELADPLMEGKYDPQEMLRMIACADACVRHSSRRRPRMSQVVRALEGDASFEELGEAMKHSPSMGFLSSSGSEFELTKYKKSGVSSQDFSSHEYGATGETITSGRSSMA